MTSNETLAEKPVVNEGTLPDDVFVATLTLRSVGNNPQIIPSIEWSHMIEGDVDERAEKNLLPHSYMAMAQIVNVINGQIREVTPDGVELPDDPDEKAQVLTAMSQKKESGAKDN